jgi:hypothetical protein
MDISLTIPGAGVVTGSIKTVDRAFGGFTGAKNLFQVPQFCKSNHRIEFGKLRPTTNRCFWRPEGSPFRNWAPLGHVIARQARVLQSRKVDSWAHWRRKRTFKQSSRLCADRLSEPARRRFR